MQFLPRRMARERQMMNDKIHEAARTLGSRGGKAPKTIAAADRQRRRDWARGLAKIREAKRKPVLPVQIGVRVVVIDRHGQRWAYTAENVAHAITLARHDGIDAVGGKLEAI